MLTMSISRTIGVTIERDPKIVYEFVLNLKNFPRWVRSTFQSIRELNGKWVAETAQGSVQLTLLKEIILEF